MVEPREKLGKIIVRQLLANTDLLESIKKVCAENGIRYGTMLTAVGSLHKLTIEGVVPSTTSKSGTQFGPPREIPGPLQLISLVGTIFDNEKGEMDTHIHGSFVDMEGKIHGGHLIEGGNTIATRLVVVIGQIANVKLVERYDQQSGHRILHLE